MRPFFSPVLVLVVGILSGSAHAGVGRPSPDELIEQSDRRALHDRSQWRALLHYEQPFWGAATSPVATSSFFLSERGDRDPRAELHATLRALRADVPSDGPDEHPACKFVARRLWLEQSLDLVPGTLSPIRCPEYQAWRGSLDARGLSLIFPEGFMSNPASVFGHTLLRVDSSREAGSEDIAGWALDFTAETEDDSGIVYMWRGMSGGYPGGFGLRPYYEQLKRYSDWENRDIWEYRLALDDAQLDLLLAHLWELGGVEFPYYFFTRNCSYALLRLLEVGVPDLEASEKFAGAVIPVDTVRAITAHPGFVDETRYRPSPETVLRTSLGTLSRREQQAVREIAAAQLEPTDPTLDVFPAARRARVLEVAYDLLRYEYLAGVVTEEASRGLSRRILLARSQLPRLDPDPSEEVEVPALRPDQGHLSSLVALGAGWRDDESYVDIQWRLGFHDLMEDAGGHLAEMQVRVLDTRLRIYPESERVRLEELTFFEIGSMNPRSRVFAPWAWSLGTGLRSRRVSDDLDDSLVWGTHFGFGQAWDPHKSLLAYALADLSLDVGSRLDHNVGFGPGGRLGLYLGPAEGRLRGHLFGQATYFGVGDTTTRLRGGAEARFTLTRDTALHLTFSAHRSYGESWIESGARFVVHF